MSKREFIVVLSLGCEDYPRLPAACNERGDGIRNSEWVRDV